MTFVQAFIMAIAAIRAKKFRSFLTMLGTIIGVASVIILFSVSEAKNAKTLEQLMSISENTITVYAYRPADDMKPGGSKDTLSDLLSRYVATDMSDVALGITPVMYGYGYDTKINYGNKTTGETLQINYGSEYYSACMGLEIEKGRDLCYMDIQIENRVCVLGSRTADFLFGFQEPIGKRVNINGFPFVVVGVYAQKDTTSDNVEHSRDFIAILPYTTARFINESNTRTSNFLVKCRDSFSVQPAIDSLNEYLGSFIDRNSDYYSGYFEVYGQSDYVSEIEETSRSDTIFLVFVAFISLFVGGIGIMNIMLVTVTERTREIGIRKAIGAPRRSIIMQFLIEASVLSLCGGIIGVVCGFIGTLFTAKIQLNLIVPPNLFITAVSVIISIVLGIGFGLYPAVKASGLQPVIALRNE